ncbi:MAG: hypothetical protein EP330_10580 [Deltaproteobacteria bacterium]|nr:MAG: hypothetical protein EP330_10580 [Deltaproteobacteria bacterium]
MITWLIASALAADPAAGLATVQLARIEGCVVTSHEATLSCKKGACTLDETLTLQEPTCAARVAFDGPSLDGAPEPLVATATGVKLPEPCESGMLCVRGASHPIAVSRVVALSQGESSVGVVLAHGDVAPTVTTDYTQAAGEGSTVVTGAPALKKPAVLKVPKAMRSAKPTSVDYYGPVDKGLRDGLWEERHAARHPIARNVTYDLGIRVMTGPWEAHTVVDDEGIARRVPELAACPREATIETMSGGLITQSCMWSDDEGSHALVASFQPEPWRLVSIGEALNGRRQGEAREFWPDGSLRERATFFEGLAVGITERWHEDGTPAGRIQHRMDGGVQSERGWSTDGQLNLEADRVAGMGANLWVRRYEGGRLVEERRPLDGLQSVIHARRDGQWVTEQESVRRTPPPDGQCFADSDCDSGICLKTSCVSTPDPASYLEDVAWFTPEAGAVKALAEHGGNGWVSAELFGGEAGCIEASARPGVGLTLDSSLGTVSRDLGIGFADEQGVTWTVGLAEKVASCVEDTDYLECGDGGFQACEGARLMVHDPGTEPTFKKPRAPRRVGECGLDCGPRTCDAEADRVTWLLGERRVAAGEAGPVRLFWDKAACEAQ